jgi:hypothetical protein
LVLSGRLTTVTVERRGMLRAAARFVGTTTLAATTSRPPALRAG